jgi:predicted nucleic acid-binding protein
MVAWIRDESAAGAVEAFLDEASAGSSHLAMSWMNVAETFYILAKRDSLVVAEQFMIRLPSLPIRLVLPDEEGVMAAARIKAGHPVAFGDAFAIALAQGKQGSVITGDGEIRRCGLVRVDWVGS